MDTSLMKDNEFLNLSEDQLSDVCGGDTQLTGVQFGLISQIAIGLIHQIFKELLPSFNWSDKGANFMSLIQEWAEYHYHIGGKSESDPKCQAIIAVLNANGFSIERIKEIFKQAEKQVNTKG